MRLVFTLFVVLFSALPARAETVVELFTSQGCSSCPPADRALEKLANNENVIALSCHVTYWDRLGWKDTLGRAFCDDRQYEYRAVLGNRNVYTPQMIVNGRYEGVGNNPLSVRGMMGRAEEDPVAAIPARVENGMLKISLPALPVAQPVRIWLVGFDARRTENIGGGENGGKKVTYVNAVTSLEQIGLWDGTDVEAVHMIAAPAEHYVVLLQQPDGAIAGAGKVSQ